MHLLSRTHTKICSRTRLTSSAGQNTGEAAKRQIQPNRFLYFFRRACVRYVCLFFQPLAEQSKSKHSTANQSNHAGMKERDTGDSGKSKGRSACTTRTGEAIGGGRVRKPTSTSKHTRQGVIPSVPHSHAYTENTTRYKRKISLIHLPFHRAYRTVQHRARLEGFCEHSMGLLNTYEVSFSLILLTRELPSVLFCLS